jgi:hypothetical protein
VTHDATDEQETQGHSCLYRVISRHVLVEHRWAWRRGHTSVSQTVFLHGWGDEPQ